MKIVSWNINQKPEAWELLRKSDYDIALLQEARQPPEGLLDKSDINPGDWKTAGIAKRNWRTAVVKLSDRVEVEWISTNPLDKAGSKDLAVSRLGTIAGATVTQEGHIGPEPLSYLRCSAPERCKRHGSDNGRRLEPCSEWRPTRQRDSGNPADAAARL
jgi:hypothetical protein